MTTVTLPTATFAAVLPHPGRYAVAPDRSLAELTAWYGPLPTHRRRVTLTDATLTVPDDPTVPGHPAPPPPGAVGGRARPGPPPPRRTAAPAPASPSPRARRPRPDRRRRPPPGPPCRGTPARRRR